MADSGEAEKYAWERRMKRGDDGTKTVASNADQDLWNWSNGTNCRRREYTLSKSAGVTETLCHSRWNGCDGGP